jgi:hypothetical protein
MDLYSPLLALALGAATAAVLLSVAARVRTWWGDGERGRSWRRAARRWGLYLGLTGVVFGLASGASHVLLGHRPGSPAALGFVAFWGAHPAWVIALFLGVASLVLSRKTST